MAKENRAVELMQLRNEVKKTRLDEVFGGLTVTERTEYDRKIQRINELEIEESRSAVAEKKSSASLEERGQWRNCVAKFPCIKNSFLQTLHVALFMKMNSIGEETVVCFAQ
jgi:hypothetical protein